MNNLDNIYREILEQLKGVKISQLSEYKMDQLLYTSIYEAANISVKSTLKIILKTLASECLEFKADITKQPLVMFTMNYHRQDHTQMWEKFKSLFSEYDEIKCDYESAYKNALPLGKIMASIVEYIKVYPQLKNIKDKKIRLHFAAYIVEMIRFKQKLDKLDLRHKVMPQYFDGSRYENFIRQYCEKKGIITVTLQHGQAVFKGKETDIYHQTIFLNFTSDYILLPGEFAKKQYLLSGADKESLIVTGTLRDIKPLSSDDHESFLVLLDCPTSHEAEKVNDQLIQYANTIAKRFEKKYKLKCHPIDDPKKYESYIGMYGEIVEKGVVIWEALQNIDFAILHISGAYLDALSVGVKAFCMELDNENSSLVEMELDKFNSIEDLTEKITVWNQMSNGEQERYYESVVEYYLSPKDAQLRNRECINRLIKEAMLGKH